MATRDNRPRYRKPPVIEVVLEFQFHPSSRPWDTVYFGKLHDRMNTVVALPTVQSVHGAAITLGPGGAAVQTALEVSTKRFAAADEGLVITVGPSLLGVSLLPQKRQEGHPGWPRLLETALRLLPIYEEVVRPNGVHQVGLRYVNVLPVNTERFHLRDYIAHDSGYLPPRFNDLREPFEFRIDHYSSAEAGFVRREVLRIVAQPHPNGGGQLVVDIDEIASTPTGVQPDRLVEVCERLHAKAWTVFDSVFTPGIRESFEPEPATSGAAL